MKIEKINYTGKVYNLEVEPTHSVYDDQFYINADTGLVVHNCHPRDNIALRWLAKEYDLGYDMFDTIMHAREIQAKNLAQFLVDLAHKHRLPIIIHGKAYKPDVPYCIGSYSTLIGHYIKEANVSLHYVDPLADDRMNVVDTVKVPAIVLMAHNRAVTYGYTGTASADIFYFDIKPNSIIVDPWRQLKDIPNCEVVHYGNTRKV
jgi:UDPglucose 6-dehydrogenase